MKLPAGFEQIGEVGVDSGQLLVCDPCYILSQWKDTEFRDIRRYRDKDTGTVYEWRVDFEKFDDAIMGSTPNKLIASGQWMKEAPAEPSGEFSYAGCCEATCGDKRAGQLYYEMGHAGVGVAFSSGYGDGVYPVIAKKNEEGRIIEVRILME